MHGVREKSWVLSDMDKDRQQLPDELVEYVDKRVARALRRQAYLALRKKIAAHNAVRKISLKSPILFMFSILFGTLAAFATMLLSNSI